MESRPVDQVLDAAKQQVESSITGLREEKTYRAFNFLGSTLEKIMQAESHAELELYQQAYHGVIKSLRHKKLIELVTHFTEEMKHTRENTLAEKKLTDYIQELDQGIAQLDEVKQTAAKKDIHRLKAAIAFLKIHANDFKTTRTSDIQQVATAVSKLLEPAEQYNKKLDECKSRLDAVLEKRYAAVESESARLDRQAKAVIGEALTNIPGGIGALFTVAIETKNAAKDVKPEQKHKPFWERAWIGLKNSVGRAREATRTFAEQHPVIAVVGGVVTAAAAVAIAFVFPPALIIAAVGLGASVVGGGVLIKKALGFQAEEQGRTARISQRVSGLVEEIEQLQSYRREQEALAKQEMLSPSAQEKQAKQAEAAFKEYTAAKKSMASSTSLTQDEKERAQSVISKFESDQQHAPTQHLSTFGIFGNLNISASHYAAPPPEVSPAPATPASSLTDTVQVQSELAALHAVRVKEIEGREEKPAPPPARRL
jgi:hypothetical protein